MNHLSPIVLAMAASAFVAQGYDFTPGVEFPRIELATPSGERMSVANFQGEKLMLHLFASW